MTRRNGTGPIGRGSMTGRGFGLCTSTDAGNHGSCFGNRLGLGCQRRFGQGLGGKLFAEQASSKTQTKLLDK